MFIQSRVQTSRLNGYGTLNNNKMIARTLSNHSLLFYCFYSVVKIYLLFQEGTRELETNNINCKKLFSANGYKSKKIIKTTLIRPKITNGFKEDLENHLFN